MKISISTYMSPWTSNDYSASLSVQVGGKYMSVTQRTDLPLDFSRLAGALARLSPTSPAVLFGMQSLEGNCVAELGLRFEPQRATDTALVEMTERDGVEVFSRETVALVDLNKLGKELLGALSDPEFEYEFSSDTENEERSVLGARSPEALAGVVANSHPDFVSRIGKLTFPCKFCGKEPMQWWEIAPDTWMPFDLETREIHQCIGTPSKRTVEWAADALIKLGYEAYVPRTSTWRMAFAANNGTGCLIFLFRKHGIDFKIYDKPDDLTLDEKGKLFTGGGQIVRNYFNESDVFLLDWIVDIAARFITETPLESSHLVGQGKRWTFDKAKAIRAGWGKQGSSELRDIYDAISGGDGADAYLGDGIWLGSGGSWSDRGR